MLTDDEIAKLCLDDAGRRVLLREHPLDASMSPQNTVYFHCDVYQGRPSYAGCLHFLEAHRAGRDVLRPECQQAVARGTCPAVQMRKRETKAGKALYAVPYAELQAVRQELAANDDNIVSFRKPASGGTVPTRKFIPSTPADLQAYAQGRLGEKQQRPEKRKQIPVQVVEVKIPPTEQELETNIFKKVLEKRLADEQGK